MFLQEEPTEAGSPRLQYWELTEELCTLMGLSKTKLADFLVKQGVNSLGKFCFSLHRFTGMRLCLLCLDSAGQIVQTQIKLFQKGIRPKKMCVSGYLTVPKYWPLTLFFSSIFRGFPKFPYWAIFRPVYIESCACVVKNVVKCSFGYLSVVHHTRRYSRQHNVGFGEGEIINRK